LIDGVGIPVIANGDFYTRDDVETFRAMPGCAGTPVMLARPALRNCSLFRTIRRENPLEQLPLLGVVRDYLHECTKWDYVYQNSKYVVMEMMTNRRHPGTLQGKLGPPYLPDGQTIADVSHCKSSSALCSLFGVDPNHHDDNAASEKSKKGKGGGQGLTDCKGGQEGDEKIRILRTEQEPAHVYSDAYFLGGESLPTTTTGGGGGGGCGGGDDERKSEIAVAVVRTANVVVEERGGGGEPAQKKLRQSLEN
jgi:hypothetical protein